jgi:UDP-N-acetylmuramate dehydrogenase
MTRPCDMLPPVRGTITRDAPLRDLVWFRAGGAAELLFRPADVEDLAMFMAARSCDMPVYVIGVGSNLLVRDGGIPGAVVRLPASFGKIEVHGARVRAGAAALDAHVGRVAADAGIAGLEFLRGVPGTVGGALRMNAGCYGREIADIFVEATALDDQGNKVTLTPADMGFSYRKTTARENLIFVEAVFEGTTDAPDRIKARMEELASNREASQPIRAKTGGSTFKNPPGLKAWELIDRAGCRGLSHGAAQVSEKHCNFLINTGEASAGDIEALGEEVKRRVWETQGVALEWEIKRIGLPVSSPAEAAS